MAVGGRGRRRRHDRDDLGGRRRLGGQVGEERRAASAARRGGRPHGQAGLGEHARHGRHQARARPARPAAGRPSATHRLQDEVVERTAGEGHAAGEGGRARGVEPELALLHPHRGREARVDLGQRELAQRPAEVALGGAAEHPHGGPRASRRRRAVSVTALRAVQRHVGEEPAVRRDAGLDGPLGRADQQGRGLVDGPLAGVPAVVGVGERAGCAAPAVAMSAASAGSAEGGRRGCRPRPR